MTFAESKAKLDKMTEKQFDVNSALLAKLHSQLIKTDKKTADAIELASMALMLYCKK